MKTGNPKADGIKIDNTWVITWAKVGYGWRLAARARLSFLEISQAGPLY